MTALSFQRLSLRVASGDSLDVRHFDVVEGMSTLFRISIEAVCPDDDIDFDAIVGQEASFSLKHAGGERTWTGVVSELHQVKALDAGPGLSTYHLELVPTLWLATQRRNYRIFQQISEIDIVKKLLTEWDIKPDLAITESYKTRKYRVQYGESDFAFMCRMLEDAGISFFFRDDDGETTLVLHDAPHKIAPRTPSLPFRDSSSDLPKDYATAVRLGQRVRPGKYTVRDHDYRLPASYALGSSYQENNVPVEDRLERYHYAPGAFLYGSDKGEDTPNADDKGKTRSDEAEGQAVAKRRLLAKRGNARVLEFDTGANDLGPGSVVTFVDHPREDLGSKNRWLLVESTLSGTHDGKWSHHCVGRTAAVEYRPPLVTPKPKVNGVESATIVGPAGDEIHTDEFGRVRVHFHWDRESQMDDNSSCWIHVVQPWSGSAYGGVNLPRVGQEVVVDFMGGDPDRPVITGRLYTNLQKVPYKLPQHKTRSAWKSDSSPGSGGFNEMMFEDLAGSELVWQHAQKNQRRVVRNDEVITVGNDRQKLVKANETETTIANRTEVVQANRTQITDQNLAASVGGNMSRLIKGDEVRRTAGNKQKAIEKNEDVVVGADKKESIGGAAHQIVQGLLSQAIGQLRSLMVGGDDQVTVGGNHALQAGKEIHLNAGQQVVIEAGSRLTIKGPGGFIDFHSGGIDIVGTLVRINSGGSAADGKGAHPAAPAAAALASPPDPPKPTPDDVMKSGINQ